MSKTSNTVWRSGQEIATKLDIFFMHLLRFHKATRRTMRKVFLLKTADTVFTDTSEFQRAAYNNSYPYKFASARINDGTYIDHKWSANLAWFKIAVLNLARIFGFIGYVVYRPDWQATVATTKQAVGSPPRRLAIMIDVESWAGQISGDHSTSINAMREAYITWLGGNRKRVIGYGNRGDLNSIWPHRGDAKVVLADYSGNSSIAGKIAHQYTSSGSVNPFGKPVDMNSADGLTPAQFAEALGLVDPPKPPTPVPTPPKKGQNMSATLYYQVDHATLGSDPWPGVFTKGDGPPEHVLDDAAATVIGQQLGVPYGPNMPKIPLEQHKLWAAGNATLLAPHPNGNINEVAATLGVKL